MGHRNNVQQPVEVKPQRFTWKTAASFANYTTALAEKERRDQADQPVKIKRRQDRFEIRVGTPIRRKVEEPTQEDTK